MKKARDGRLFKVDVPQAVEKITVFNHSKKCFCAAAIFGVNWVYFAPL